MKRIEPSPDRFDIQDLFSFKNYMLSISLKILSELIRYGRTLVVSLGSWTTKFEQLCI